MRFCSPDSAYCALPNPWTNTFCCLFAVSRATTAACNRWEEQLPLFVADMALHLRASLFGATTPLTLLSLARDACRRVCTRDVREAFRARQKTHK